MNENQIIKRGEIIKSNASCNFEAKIIQESIDELVNEQGMPWRWSKNLEPQEGERFKTIKNHPCYEVSNYGRVRSSQRKKSIILKPARNGDNGKFRVRLVNSEQTNISDLMYETFIGSIGNKLVEYLDHEKRNLILTNLVLKDHRLNKSTVLKMKNNC